MTTGQQARTPHIMVGRVNGWNFTAVDGEVTYTSYVGTHQPWYVRFYDWLLTVIKSIKLPY